MPSNESTRPGYVPSIGGASTSGAILFSAAQSLTLSQQSVARNNMGLGSAATANMAPVASVAGAGELVRGDDLRWGYFAGKADLVLGKLAAAQLPDYAVTVAVSVPNQSTRLTLSADAARGRIFRDDDTKISYCLIAGGTPSNAAHWLSVGDSVVTLNDINGITSLGISLCGATTPAIARAAMALANVADATGTDIAIQGNLILGDVGANKLTIAVNALLGPITVNASYRSGGGTFYWCLTSNADGTLALADVVGLTTALASKADLVGGKVPLSQLPSIVGSLTSSVSVANATARLAMTSTEAAGVIVVQADDKTSWMLVAGGVPSNPLAWNQVGDAEVRVAEIVDAGVVGQQLLLAEDDLAARNVLGMGEAEAITFASVYLGSGLMYFQMSAGVFKSLSKPATMTGSGWTLPNRAGFLAYSPNADGSLAGPDISGGNPIFFGITTGGIVQMGIHTHNPGASDRWLSGAYSLTQTVSTLTANRTQSFPNGAGTYALVVSATGVIAQTDVTGLTATLAGKASLVGGKVPVSQLPDSTLTNFSNGAGTSGQVAGDLVLGAATANTFRINVAGMSAPLVVLPPLSGTRMVTIEEVTPAKGLRTGRTISSDGASTITQSDFGSLVEVVLGIATVTFPLYGAVSAILPAVLDLRITAVEQPILGNVYDVKGFAVAALPAGVYRIVLTVDSGSVARYVVQNYKRYPLRELASEYTPSNYVPVAGWRAGGNGNELGAHMAALDAALVGQRGWYAVRHNAQQMLLDGDNIISLNASGGTVDASQNCSLLSNSHFAPAVDGTWMLHLSFWLVYDPEDADIAGGGGYGTGPVPRTLRMQTLGTLGWTDYGDQFPILVEQAQWQTSSAAGGGGFGGPNYQLGKRYDVRAVVDFLVSGAGTRRQLRFVLPGKSPSGVLYIGHPTVLGGDDPYFPGATALQFHAQRL